MNTPTANSRVYEFCFPSSTLSDPSRRGGRSGGHPRVLQRCEPPASDGPLLVSGALKIDMATREVTVNGCSLELTATEEAVLYILARHAGKLVPCQRLIRAVWGTDAATKLSELHVYIARLRRKLEEHGGNNLLRGEGSAGYRLSLTADRECVAPKTVF